MSAAGSEIGRAAAAALAQTGQVRIAARLSAAEFAGIEARFGLTFGADHRAWD